MDKPSIRLIVIGLVIQAAWEIGGVLITVQRNELSEGVGLGWLDIALIVLLLIAAALVSRYRQIGLLLGGALTLLDAALRGYSAVYLSINVVTIIMLVIDAMLLYLCYKYLTHEPEKLAFK